MGSEEWEEIKDGVKRRMNTGYPAAYRRRQCHTPDNHFTRREQFPNQFHRHTAHIRVGRIVIDEVIPEYPPPPASPNSTYNLQGHAENHHPVKKKTPPTERPPSDY